MRKQVLLAIIFISSVFSMQGMVTALQRARFARLQGPNMHKNLAASFSFYKKPLISVVSHPEVSSPLSTGIQKRFYSSSASSAPKQTGFWNWITSFVAQNPVPELRTKGIEGIMHELLYPDHEKAVVDRAGMRRVIRSFDENDLEKAKEKIDKILELNENYKTSILSLVQNIPWFGKADRSVKNLRTEESVFSTVLFGAYGHYFNTWNRTGSKVVRYGFEGTILDEVLYKVFSGESGTGFYTTADNVLHYIQLAQWLVDKGFKIKPGNEKHYMLGYAYLMDGYKELYRSRFSVSLKCIDEDSFKKIFLALDRVLEKFIVTPELQQELRQFQQERREIDANPQEYRKKMEEEDRRGRYIGRKAEELEWEYRSRTGDWDKDSSSFRSYVQFDELEYEEWKKTGYLRGEKEELEQERQQREFERNVFGEDPTQRQQKIEELRERFRLPSNASAEMVMQHFRVIENKIGELKTRFELPFNASAGMVMQSVKSYIKGNHPDTLKSNKDVSPEEKDKKSKEYGEFIGRYDDVLKELKRREKGEEQDKESAS